MPRATDIIDPKTAGTIAGLFRERVRRTPHASAYRHFNIEERRFEIMSWNEMFLLAARWQGALERESLRPGDRVAVILRNCPEWVLFDVAALGLGLVTVPLFADDRPANIAHILKESGSRFVLLEEETLWRRIEEEAGLLPEIERIVALHPAFSLRSESDNGEVLSPTNTKCDPRVIGLTAWLSEEDRTYRVNCRDAAELATIVYTSGTTGMPKGVMLSHGNILENAFACLQCESIYPEDLFLSFLPLSHTFERTVGYYIPMMAGACVAYVRSIDKLSEDLLEVRPTVLISVPRIYERIHKKIAESLKIKPALDPSPLPPDRPYGMATVSPSPGAPEMDAAVAVVADSEQDSGTARDLGSRRPIALIDQRRRSLSAYHCPGFHRVGTESAAGVWSDRNESGDFRQHYRRTTYLQRSGARFPE